MRAAAKSAVAVLLVCALFGSFVAIAPAASAQSVFDDDRVTFGGVNGTAYAVRAVGDQLWVGGEFSAAFDPNHTTSYPRQNLAVFDFNTGEVLPLTADTNDKIEAIESDDESTVWVAGNFTQIDGQGATYIAAFDAFTGEIDDDFDITVGYEVNALHYQNGWLYIGGEFSQVDGLNYGYMARVDPLSGTLDTSFQPHPDGVVRAIHGSGDRVYAAGYFEEVGNAPDNYPRRWVAGLDADTGQPAGPQFPFAALGPGEGPGKAGVTDLHVSEDGDHLYTADQRNYITQWDRATGQKLWQRGAEGDIQAVVDDGSTVYVGTHDGFMAEDDERLLFALNEADGTTDFSFEPFQNSFFGTLAITVSQGALIAVGEFTTVNGVNSPHVAVFHSDAWTGADPLTPPFLLGDVSCDSVPDIGDALLVAQFSVGLRVQVDTCPLSDPQTQIGPGGDVNGDGAIDVADALLIARCSVGLTNVFCPE